MARVPVLLALDTATSVCSVALSIAGVTHEFVRDVGQRHTQHLLPMIEELLGAHSLSLDQCDAIAFGAGPGSFTGLRVACGVAQGLAFGIDRPVIPVSNLAALAADVFERHPAARRVLVAMDARMNEAYWAVYEFAGGELTEVAPAGLAVPADLVHLAVQHDAGVIAGSALQSFGEELRPFAGVRVDDAAGSARSIAQLALGALRIGATVDAAAAAPLYVRDRVALTVEERRTRAAASVAANR
jgi:tRNA threonylcarbamoyladenosine biosynthesis protein TsaB